MSEDANGIEEQELDIISMLASQGESDGDEDVDESEGFTGELPSDPEELKALLLKEREIKSKRNKSLRKSKDATHRMQEELNSMQAMIQELKQSGSQQSNDGTNIQEQKEALEKWRDSVRDEPEKAIDFMMMQQTESQNKVVDFMASMQQSFEQQISEIKSEMDPNKIKYRDKVNAMKANPALAGIPEEYLAKMAEAVEPIKIPRGSIGGRRVDETHTPEKAQELLREKYRKMFNG